MASQSTEAAGDGTESTEQAPEPTETETPEEPEAPAESPDEEEPQKPQEMVYATDKVNVRGSASTEGELIGSIEKGTQIARTGTEGEWSIVDYGGQTGYIKSEYLSTEVVEKDPEPEEEENESSNPVSIAEGTVITLKEAVNIRSSMSETADKIGTAYEGEKVTVQMSYAEGWSKVTWNGKTGYVKSSLLQ